MRFTKEAAHRRPARLAPGSPLRYWSGDLSASITRESSGDRSFANVVLLRHYQRPDGSLGSTVRLRHRDLEAAAALLLKAKQVLDGDD